MDTLKVVSVVAHPSESNKLRLTFSAAPSFDAIDPTNYTVTNITTGSPVTVNSVVYVGAAPSTQVDLQLTVTLGVYKIQVADVAPIEASVGVFDGDGDYLAIADNIALEPVDSDLTWEMWIKTTNSNQYATLYSRSPSGFSSGMWTLMMNYQSSTAGDLALALGDYSTGVPLLTTTGVSINDGLWHHVAVVRNGSAWNIYVDGVSRASNTWSGTVVDIAGEIRVGMDQAYTRYYTGLMDDLRITKGVARYTSTFTPPEDAVLAGDPYASNVSLLLKMNGSFNSTTFIDSSNNNFPVTVYGNTKITSEIKRPYPYGYFDGNGDYLAVASDPVLDFAADDFTIEMWVSPTATNNYWIMGKGDAATVAGSAISFYNGGTWDFYYGSSILSLTRPTLSTNVWQHIAVVRNSSTITIYKDGVSVSSGSIGTNTINTGGSNPLQIGLYSTVGYAGLMNDLRITKGVARYTSDFTPPNNITLAGDPYAANVSLLIKMDGPSGSTTFTDISNNSLSITRYGDTKILAPSRELPIVGDPILPIDGIGYFSNYVGATYASTQFDRQAYAGSTWPYALSPIYNAELIKTGGVTPPTPVVGPAFVSVSGDTSKISLVFDQMIVVSGAALLPESWTVDGGSSPVTITGVSYINNRIDLQFTGGATGDVVTLHVPATGINAFEAPNAAYSGTLLIPYTISNPPVQVGGKTLSFNIFNKFSRLPILDAAPVFIYYGTPDGLPMTTPEILNLGNGKYSFSIPDSDTLLGVAYFIDTGTNSDKFISGSSTVSGRTKIFAQLDYDGAPYIGDGAFSMTLTNNLGELIPSPSITPVATGVFKFEAPKNLGGFGHAIISAPSDAYPKRTDIFINHEEYVADIALFTAFPNATVNYTDLIFTRGVAQLSLYASSILNWSITGAPEAKVTGVQVLQPTTIRVYHTGLTVGNTYILKLPSNGIRSITGENYNDVLQFAISVGV